MNTYKININRTEVLNEVSEHSAYIGAKTSDYDRAATLEEDSDFLSKFLEQSCLSLAYVLKGVTSGGWVVEEDFCSLTVRLPESFPNEKLTELSHSAKACLVNDILSRWLVLLSRPDAAYYKSQAGEELRGLQELVYSRERPQKNWFRNK